MELCSLDTFKKSYFDSFCKLKVSARDIAPKSKQGYCFGGFGGSAVLVLPGGVLLLSYLDITLRKTSVCGWELLVKCCQSDFYFLIMEFSIFTQIKYLDVKALLATPSDGNCRVVCLLILDLHNFGICSR